MVEQNNNENVKNEGFFNSLKNNVNKVLDKVLQFVPEYLRSRFIPAIIMSILAIIILYSPLFNLCILAVAILMAFEWILISQNEDVNNKWKFLGLGYIMLPCASLMYIKGVEGGADIILWLFLVVWGTDIAGMIGGKAFGGPKLAPVVSPKKTWSGLISGVVVSMFIGLLSSVIFKQSAIFFIALSGFLAFVEQMSDLLESKFKRHFGVKDSGNLIPGHGGIMDRVDGLTLTAPLVALLVLLSKTIF